MLNTEVKDALVGVDGKVMRVDRLSHAFRIGNDVVRTVISGFLEWQDWICLGAVSKQFVELQRLALSASGVYCDCFVLKMYSVMPSNSFGLKMSKHNRYQIFFTLGADIGRMARLNMSDKFRKSIRNDGMYVILSKYEQHRHSLLYREAANWELSSKSMLYDPCNCHYLRSPDRRLGHLLERTASRGRLTHPALDWIDGIRYEQDVVYQNEVYWFAQSLNEHYGRLESLNERKYASHLATYHSHNWPWRSPNFRVPRDATALGWYEDSKGMFCRHAMGLDIVTCQDVPGCVIIDMSRYMNREFMGGWVNMPDNHKSKIMKTFLKFLKGDDSVSGFTLNAKDRILIQRMYDSLIV